jgi:diguanylate cyclase (GGDEF)-like protein
MRSLHHPAPTSKLLARIAVAGMSLAVLALGALAVWAAIVTQNGADGLSRAGVQTSGHLRAVQALSLLDTQADTLEEEVVPREVEKLRGAQRVLDDALHRMEHGDVREAGEIADRALPVVQRLKPAVDRFLDRRPGVGVSESAEDGLEEVLTQLFVLLNDLDADPSQLLTTKLEAVTATERTVRTTAIVLIPLGLGGVAACAWLLSLYRRRAEATMLAALATTAEEARTDELTGLPNRRALLEELDLRMDRGEPFTLTIADLNGFKRYNDTFGHPAGDALLRRLGRKLAAACEGRGFAARLGGDEFCVVFGAIDASEAHALLGAALSEQGEGFRITAASGLTSVPEEAGDASAALRLADSRMYASKAGSRPSADESMSLALTRMLDERHPGLGSHVEEVAVLAVACAETLDLSEEDVQTIGRAAELHDLGKVAIPASILTKAGPLNEEEWEFMRRHSIVGERILSGVPALARVAPTVRSSHERWDGAGYPDGLAGEDIPIGARIIFIADSYCAMTEQRPYAEERSIPNARRELLACAGSQFDPAAVTAFLAMLDDRTARAAAQPPPVAA